MVLEIAIYTDKIIQGDTFLSHKIKTYNKKEAIAFIERFWKGEGEEDEIF